MENIEIGKKIQDNQHVKSELFEGVEYLKPLLKRVSSSDFFFLEILIKSFADEKKYVVAIKEAVSSKLTAIFTNYSEKLLANKLADLQVYVDIKKVLFIAWYELFLGSSKGTHEHDTLKDCEALLPRVAKMSFDTLYFPPVYPIGEVNRKGINNATDAKSGIFGSPWEIGSQCVLLEFS